MTVKNLKCAHVTNKWDQWKESANNNFIDKESANNNLSNLQFDFYNE